MTVEPRPFSAGVPRPLGATCRDGGVNFSIYSEHASAAELLLYAEPSSPEPTQTIVLEHRQHRAGNCWHVFVAGVGPGQCYAWRMRGPWEPAKGHRFDPRLELLDPYARLIVPRGAHGRDGFMSVVADPTAFDWQGTERPRIHPNERIIYEMHLAGFTRDPSSGVANPGTIDGLIEKIPWLVDLGVTSVELLPIFAFDPDGARVRHPISGEPLRDYWGYNPLGFFAPHHAYLDRAPELSVAPLQELVRALHAAGLEVILDVVYNHTGEHGLDGPTRVFRGVDNATYYLVRPDGTGRYLDFTGCGNTVRCAHPAVRRMILDSLRYWATIFQVDGFRFDLASVLSRDDEGQPIEDPPLLWEIEGDPLLESRALIAEAWDAGGLYQVGRFPGERWAEWNGRFRDDVRRFWRGDPGMTGTLAQRMLGSPDLYERAGRQPAQGVNFVTCHDGFTLADLVSYQRKHNLDNGEGGKDGGETATAHNHGVEGPTDDRAILAVRRRQQKNLLATLFLAQGTPMLLAGDELGRTQRGNNNAWCQDNAISWTDWRLFDEDAPDGSDAAFGRELHRFVRQLIRFRRRHNGLHRSRYLLGWDAPEGHDTPGYTRVRWHGRRPDAADWGAANRLLAYTLLPAQDDVAIHIVLNADPDDALVTLPPVPPPYRALPAPDTDGPAPRESWRRAIDTALPSPDDILPGGQEDPLPGDTYLVTGRSTVVFVASTSAPFASGRATQMMVIPRPAR